MTRTVKILNFDRGWSRILTILLKLVMQPSNVSGQKSVKMVTLRQPRMNIFLQVTFRGRHTEGHTRTVNRWLETTSGLQQEQQGWTLRPITSARGKLDSRCFDVRGFEYVHRM